MNRQKVFFVLEYIGALKHYERFVEYLKDKYDVGFLIISRDSARRRETIAYCEEKRYVWHVIDAGLTKSQKIRVPFFTPLKERYEHSVACRNFLEQEKPAKIISYKALYSYDTIFKEANKKGIETILLQWSASTTRRIPIVTRENKTILRKIYLYILKIISNVLDIFYIEPRFGHTPAIIEKLGVFDSDEAKNGMGKIYKYHLLRILGSTDFQIVDELKNKINSDMAFKKKLLKKYGLEDKKLKINVILFRFHFLRINGFKMTIDECVAHYYKMFQIIREVFPNEEADIILKLHPSEIGMVDSYEPYKKLGVKLYYGESKTEELVCLSDLCISCPPTSANYMIIASNTPSIFVNFSDLKIINDVAEHFSIKYIVEDFNKFFEMLKQFKYGKLEKQYDSSLVEYKSVDRTIDFINI